MLHQVDIIFKSTGCSDPNLSKMNVCITEKMHFWHYVVKVKTHLWGDICTQIAENKKHLLENCKQILEN